MKYKVALKTSTSLDWVDAVKADFTSFLQDHADCERKASGLAQNLTAKYPDRLEIIDDLMAIAIEELEHFRQVYKIMEDRGIPLASRMEKDLYINQFIAAARNGREERYMDRVLMAGIVEARAAERFILIGEHLEDKSLAKFYIQLGRSEEKHIHVFIKMCSYYFSDEEINIRLNELLEVEAEILANLPITAKLH
tara:strand:- start:2134 stop:2718 length:585 start_codon:yes stop_codon:yes gene_type:complete